MILLALPLMNPLTIYVPFKFRLRGALLFWNSVLYNCSLTSTQVCNNSIFWANISEKKINHLFFTFWKKKSPSFSTALPATLSPLSLSCLVQIASVRRSLFNNSERGKFLNQLVAGVRDILQNPSGLTDPNNYHEFCRLLARLKSNYQLGELVMVDQYPESIQVICFWVFLHHVKNYLLH